VITRCGLSSPAPRCQAGPRALYGVLGGELGGLGGDVVPFRKARRSVRRRALMHDGGLMARTASRQ